MAGGRHKRKQKKTKDVENVSELQKPYKPDKLDSNTTNVSDASSRKRFSDHRSNINNKKIDSSIITTKRLTVGTKGIFGNARSSNSVYRDIQERLENRKMSKEVSSEIEHNLSRILPNRKKCGCRDKCSSNDDTGFQTPGNSSTPLIAFNNNTKSATTCSSRSAAASISSVNSVSSCETTPIVKDNFSKVASEIVASIPNLKLLKDINLLGSLRLDLQKMYQEKHKLVIKPKFEKDDFTQNVEIAPASKKHCANYIIKETPPVAKTTAAKMARVEREDVVESSSPMIQDNNEPLSLAEKLGITTTNRKEPMEISRESTQTKPEVTTVPHPKKFDLFTTDTIHPNRKQHLTEQYENSDKRGGPLATMQSSSILNTHAQRILSQPISSLRCNRRRSIRGQGTIAEMYESQSDLLDYIDSIPLKALENRLLGNNDTRSQLSSEISSSSASLPHHHHVTSELTKPSLESPSPPKMYRMNMF